MKREFPILILIIVAVAALLLMFVEFAPAGETVNVEVTADVVPAWRDPDPTPEPIGPTLQKLSVNVLASGNYRSSQGSGTIFLSDVYLDEDIETAMPAAFVITAHHVVAGLREVSTVIGSDGSELSSIRYRDAQVIQEQVENSRTVGEVKYDAKVISVDPRRDIALLRVRKGDFADLGASFYFGESVPSAGTEIYHCGAPGGKEIGGTCSLTSGIISRIGVRIPGFGGGSELGIFDQTDTAALGGSSGGMIALKSNGEWIGMITLGLRAGDNFHWVVPQRSVLSWAKEVNIMWLFDKDLQRPTEDDIKAIVLENISPGYAGENKAAPTPAVPRCSSGELFVTPNVMKGDFNE